MSSTYATSDHFDDAVEHPVNVRVEAAIDDRNRVTTAFRFFLALPHLILVGGPTAAIISWKARGGSGGHYDWSGSTGILGAVVLGAVVIAWLAILFTSRYPDVLYRFASWYLRWRVRAGTYLMLLRDEYPPFGDDVYPAELQLVPQEGDRNRLTVFFRPILAFPHLVLLWVLGMIWVVTTIVAWISIVFTGVYPRELHRFGVGALRWTTRVEAYLLLLQDAYPPFTIGR